MQKLRQEKPAILRWLVAGCTAWQSEGLNPPAEVMVATEDYKVESDNFAQWWDETVIAEQSSDCRSGAAYRAYTAWCDHSGERSISLKRFGDRVTAKGITKRHSNGVIYEGIRLVSTTETEVTDQWRGGSG